MADMQAKIEIFYEANEKLTRRPTMLPKTRTAICGRVERLDVICLGILHHP